MGTKVRQTQDPERSWLLGKFPLTIKGLRIKLDNNCKVPDQSCLHLGIPWWSSGYQSFHCWGPRFYPGTEVGN